MLVNIPLTCRHWYWSNLLTLLKTLSMEPMMLGCGPVSPSPLSFSLQEGGEDSVKTSKNMFQEVLLEMDRSGLIELSLTPQAWRM